MSDDEEELPIPDAASFVFLCSTEVNPADAYIQSGQSGPEPHTNTLRDASNLGRGPLEPQEMGQANAIEPEDWRDLMSTAISNNPAALANLLAPKTQVVDYRTMGRLYTRELASRNTHTLGSKGTPNAILQMAYRKAYIPLSMLTETALTCIHSNDGLKYVKVLNSTVKQTLDPSQFGNEDDLPFEVWDQAYLNWLVLLRAISDDDVLKGAWRNFDKELRMQFTSDPLIINTDHLSYLHGFERARMDQVEEQSEE